MKLKLKPQRVEKLVKFSNSLEIDLKSYNLLDEALTHSSYLKDNSKVNIADNERLEFYGDAVLKLCISEYLMKKYPDYNEGMLSSLRAYIVSEKVLTKVANKINIKSYLLVGKNEKKNLPDSIKADAVEAVLAVIYYECGLRKVKDFILSHWVEHIEYANNNKEKENYKAVLQEYTQSKSLGLPTYKTIKESGPDHSKQFEVAVSLGEKEYARGKGKTKKEASQVAASNALVMLKKLGENIYTNGKKVKSKVVNKQLKSKKDKLYNAKN